ncbi:MAG: hypothetical protein Q8927_09390 [Bacteroidota bacterium]|nr:hypothetical protein [Bacteroidota bacterium]MDP4253631.1 hypothetical protein [Bacteroidota bacterium]
MKKTTLLLALLPLTFLPLVRGLYAQESTAQTHAGHFLFRVPEGWKTTQQGDLFSMTPPDLGSDELLSFLFLAPVTDTGFLAVADATISQVATAMQGTGITQPFANHPLYFQLYSGQCLKGWDYSMGTGSIRMPYKDPNNPYVTSIDFTIGVFLARLNGRMERVCYISRDFKCGNYETTTSYKWTYGPVVDDFFFNLEFDDWKDTHSRPGKISNTGISAVWSGVSYIQGMYRASFFVLFDNGQVYYNSDLPKYGLSNLNTIAAAANDPPHWGTYSYQGGSGVMKISWQTIPFSIADGRMSAGLNGAQRTFQKMPFLEKVRLAGTWNEFKGAISIAFTADGQFTDQGVLRSIEHRPTTCNEALPEKAQGTYEISNHSIIFHYAGGMTTQAALAELDLHPGVCSPDQLILGWHNDVLEKNKP